MKRALVVDNNEFYRKVLTDLLIEEGYDVAQASDGLAALQEAKNRRPDLVLLDLVMPKVDGTQVCRFFKSDAELRDVPVVVLSGILVEDMDRVSDIGADAYVAKMPLDRLLPKLSSVVRRLEEGCSEVPVEGFEDLFRREVVAELLEEKRFREHIIASLVEGAAELDSSQRILSVNPAFARLAGVDELTVLGKTFAEVLGLEPEDWEGVLQAEDGPSRRHEVFRLGDRRVLIKVSSVQRGEHDVGYLVLLEDVTDLVQAQEEKDTLQRELARTEKLSALGRMVAGIAHELNNPLTGVLGFTQILMRATPQDEATRRNLEKVFREATRCKGILENLQSFSNRSMPERKGEDLCDILDGVLAQLSDEFERMNVEVLCETDPDIPAVPVDRLDFKKILQQLIANACRAMEGQSGPRRLRLRLACVDDRVHLEVQDSGIGIPPENLERIFDPFYSTADVGQGMGLGLSMIYGIVRDHQGHILVSSRPDEGSTFTVDLPMYQEEDHVNPQAETSSERLSVEDGSTPVRRVLVVDDEPVILDLLLDLLEAKGVQVETAESGAGALEKMAAHSFDAVVLDLRMPGMDGREVFETIRRRYPEMASKVLFATGDMVSKETRDFLRDTGAPCIQKPFQIDQLLDTLLTFLKQGSVHVSARAGELQSGF